jgi:hypothetical protein
MAAPVKPETATMAARAAIVITAAQADGRERVMLRLPQRCGVRGRGFDA